MASIEKPSSNYDSANSKVDDLLASAKTPQDNADFYDKWATAYDKDLAVIEYGGPKQGADLVAQYIPDQKSTILDVAAGTGLVVEELKKLGRSYPNIDGLDGSANMLDLAKKKGLYKKYICSFMSKEPTPGLEANSYDGIVTVGSFSSGHLPSDTVEEFIRVVKPGGYVIIVMRENFLHSCQAHFEELMSQLEGKGLWKRVEKRLVPGYYGPHQGACFVYQTC